MFVSTTETKWYWAILFFVGLFLELVALYYQYALGEEPCQVCVHIRIWVAAFTVLALLMWILPSIRLLDVLARALVCLSMAGLLERSWYLYQIESGRGQGSCEFTLGFPDWFALDRWFPAVFEVRNLCSFSPEVLFGITMAESLLFVSFALLCASSIGLFMGLRRHYGGTR